MTPQKIAVLYTGRDVIGTDMAVSLAASIRSFGHYVVVGAPTDSRAEHFFRDHSNQLDEFRSYTWQLINKVEFEQTFDLNCPHTAVVRPLDGGLDFRDCDMWIFVGELPLSTIAPLKPYSLFVADGIEFVRRNPVEVSEAVINTLRGANHLWFSTAKQLSDWRAIAQLFETPLNVGRPFDDVKPIAKQTNISPANEYIVCFASPNILTTPLNFLPELESYGIHSLTYDQMVIVPIERQHSGEYCVLRWQDNMPLDNTFENVYSAIAGSSLVLCNSMFDPFDFRIRAAQKLRKKILMVWNAKYGEYPKQACSTVKVFEPKDRVSFEFAIKSELAETDKPTANKKTAQVCFDNSAPFDERVFSTLLMKAVGK